MANIYVKSGGSNTSPWDTWAKAAPDFETVRTTIAAGDNVYINAETYAVTPGTQDWDLSDLEGVSIYGSNDTVNEPPLTAGVATMDPASGTGTSYSIRGLNLYISNIVFKTNTAGQTGSIYIQSTEDGSIELENCKFQIANTGAISAITVGKSSTSATSLIVTKNCTFSFSYTSQGIQILNGRWESYGDDFYDAGSVPDVLFENVTGTNTIRIEGADFTGNTGYLFEQTPASVVDCEISNSKFDAGMVFADEIFVQTTNAAGAGNVWLYNCSSGDNHYEFAHFNGLGSTIAKTTVVATATFDGTNKIGWHVSSTALASKNFPYRSPWISVYNSGTTSITPYLDCVRSGSATKYRNSQVWAEATVQATSGSTRSTFRSDKVAILAADALQSNSSLGASDWTGEGGTSAFFDIDTGSAITPAEIGDIKMRVCVGLASVTDLYVDPIIKW